MREARASDIPRLLALEQECYPPGQAYGRAEYEHAIRQGRAINLVEEDGDRLVGFVGAFHHRSWRIGHVFTLNVAPAARRHGIAARLMDACEARLEALGMERVRLEVNVENAAAIRLYEARGYLRMGRIEDYYSGYPDNAAFVYELPLPRNRPASPRSIASPASARDKPSAHERSSDVR